MQVNCRIWRQNKIIKQIYNDTFKAEINLLLLYAMFYQENYLFYELLL